LTGIKCVNYFVGADKPKLDGDGGGAEIRCCSSLVQFFGVTMPDDMLFFASIPNMSRKACPDINKIRK
jgi:hypothetical protein